MAYKDPQKKKEYELKHREANKESRKEYQKKYRLKNKEKRALDCKKYYEAHKKPNIKPSEEEREALKEQNKQLLEEKREALKEQNKQLLIERQETIVFNKNEKVCEFCGKIFVVKNVVNLFCSRSCCKRASYKKIKNKKDLGGPTYACPICCHYWQLPFDPIIDFELFKKIVCPNCGFSKKNQTYDSYFLYDDDIEFTNKSLEELKNEEIEKIKEEKEQDLLEQTEANKAKRQQVTDKTILDRENKQLEADKLAIAKIELQKKKIFVLDDVDFKDDYDCYDQEIGD